MEKYFYLRNRINGFLYKGVFKKIFFRIDPEVIHDRMISFGKFLGTNPIARGGAKFLFNYSNKKLRQNILGIDFPNPVGLAAGFDKDALLTDILPCIGFGFVEVGSVTGEPCSGNPKPRLWRLEDSRALVVNYGLKNEGCEAISKRLKDKAFKIPVGISIAKTNSKKTVDIEEGIKDYVKAYSRFAKIGSYTTINISCPNSFGGQPFTDAKKLDKLLSRISKIPTKKPIFLKISPDLTRKEVDGIIRVSEHHGIEGFICANLTKKMNSKEIFEKKIPKTGGISGKVVEHLSNDLIRHVYRKTKGRIVIIGCGGVFSAEDAYKKIKLGASLVQLVTSMIFEGPQVLSEINQGLVHLAQKDGFSNISQAIGAGNKQ